MFKRILGVFKALFPIVFASQLSAFPTPRVAATHFPTRFKYYGRTNGASRKRKTNMLRVSRQRRLKHRHA